jgi:hypothetical protein
VERRTDALGNLDRGPDAIAEPAAWTADARMALAIKVGRWGGGEGGGEERAACCGAPAPA